MPRTKKPYVKKTSYRKGSPYATKKDVSQMIEKKHRIPNKFFTTSVDDTDIATAGSFWNLAIVPEGNGESERNSRKIHISKVEWRGRLTPINTAASCTIRICLVKSVKGGGGTPSITSLFNRTVDPVNSFRQQDYADSFIFYVDKVVTFNQTTYVSPNYGGGDKFVKISHKFKYPMVVNYNDTAANGAVTTQPEGQLWLCMFAIPDEHGYCESEAQIQYFDD